MKKDASNDDLQKRLRADDKSALEFVYNSYKKEFLNYAKQYNIDGNEALDIFQDAVIALYQKFTSQQVHLTNSTVKTYLFGIGKHKIFDTLKLKKNYLKVEKEFEDYDEIKLENDSPNYYQKQLSSLIENISESCRELLRLYYYRNLTINEIVEQSHYKDANTVKSHKSRCMKRLKALASSK